MDERAIKRLLVIVVISIVAIMLFKTMMSNTIVNLNRVAAEKKQAAKPFAAQEEAMPASDAANIGETPAASTTGEAATPEVPAASRVNETR
jgi:hypothetical protein